MKSVWQYIKTKASEMVDFLQKHNNSALALVAIFTLMTAVFFNVLTYRVSNHNLDLLSKSIEQSKAQLQFLEKSLPSQFEMKFSDAGLYTEQPFISNVGVNNIYNINVDFKYYFISPDYTLNTRQSIQSILEMDTILFNHIRSKGIIDKPSDLDYLLGTSRKYFLSYINSKDLSSLEASPSSFMNAIKLADALNAQVFTRWKITFIEELTSKVIVSNIYVWHRRTNSTEINGLELRPNLATIIGGKKIINLIEEYEETSPEIIFKTIDHEE